MGDLLQNMERKTHPFKRENVFSAFAACFFHPVLILLRWVFWTNVIDMSNSAWTLFFRSRKNQWVRPTFLIIKCAILLMLCTGGVIWCFWVWLMMSGTRQPWTSPHITVPHHCKWKWTFLSRGGTWSQNVWIIKTFISTFDNLSVDIIQYWYSTIYIKYI